jgi:hypothetical protein
MKTLKFKGFRSSGMKPKFALTVGYRIPLYVGGWQDCFLVAAARKRYVPFIIVTVSISSA